MTAAPEPDVMYSDVSEEQEQFRQAQREAIGEALELPIDDARERLEELAADEQRWLAEQRRTLREMAGKGGRCERHVRLRPSRHVTITCPRYGVTATASCCATTSTAGRWRPRTPRAPSGPPKPSAWRRRRGGSRSVGGGRGDRLRTYIARDVPGVAAASASQPVGGADLAAVLSKAADNRRQPPHIRDVPLLLPDGRELIVVVQLIDAGHRRDARGHVVEPDGRSWADVSGDFTLHVAARNVLDSASVPYPHRLTRAQAAELDERRIRAKLDRVLPAIAGDDWLIAQREEVYRRAKAIADATRAKRIASAGRGPAGGRDCSGWSR